MNRSNWRLEKEQNLVHKTGLDPSLPSWRNEKENQLVKGNKTQIATPKPNPPMKNKSNVFIKSRQDQTSHNRPWKTSLTLQPDQNEKILISQLQQAFEGSPCPAALASHLEYFLEVQKIEISENTKIHGHNLRLAFFVGKELNYAKTQKSDFLQRFSILFSDLAKRRIVPLFRWVRWALAMLNVEKSCLFSDWTFLDISEFCGLFIGAVGFLLPVLLIPNLHNHPFLGKFCKNLSFPTTSISFDDHFSPKFNAAAPVPFRPRDSKNLYRGNRDQHLFINREKTRDLFFQILQENREPGDLLQFLMPQNFSWFAEFLTDQLRLCIRQSIHETDEDVQRLANPQKLQKLSQRLFQPQAIPSKKSTDMESIIFQFLNLEHFGLNWHLAASLTKLALCCSDPMDKNPLLDRILLLCTSGRLLGHLHTEPWNVDFYSQSEFVIDDFIEIYNRSTKVNAIPVFDLSHFLRKALQNASLLISLPFIIQYLSKVHSKTLLESITFRNILKDLHYLYQSEIFSLENKNFNENHKFLWSLLEKLFFDTHEFVSNLEKQNDIGSEISIYLQTQGIDFEILENSVFIHFFGDLMHLVPNKPVAKSFKKIIPLLSVQTVPTSKQLKSWFLYLHPECVKLSEFILENILSNLINPWILEFSHKMRFQEGGFDQLVQLFQNNWNQTQQTQSNSLIAETFRLLSPKTQMPQVVDTAIRLTESRTKELVQQKINQSVEHILSSRQEDSNLSQKITPSERLSKWLKNVSDIRFPWAVIQTIFSQDFFFEFQDFDLLIELLLNFFDRKSFTHQDLESLFLVFYSQLDNQQKSLFNSFFRQFLAAFQNSHPTLSLAFHFIAQKILSEFHLFFPSIKIVD